MDEKAVSQLVSFGSFCDSIPISRITGWRWRKLGWIQTVDIAGRQYVTAEEAARFKARATAGEFRKGGK